MGENQSVAFTCGEEAPPEILTSSVSTCIVCVLVGDTRGEMWHIAAADMNDMASMLLDAPRRLHSESSPIHVYFTGGTLIGRRRHATDSEEALREFAAVYASTILSTSESGVIEFGVSPYLTLNNTPSEDSLVTAVLGASASLCHAITTCDWNNLDSAASALEATLLHRHRSSPVPSLRKEHSPLPLFLEMLCLPHVLMALSTGLFSITHCLESLPIRSIGGHRISGDGSRIAVNVRPAEGSITIHHGYCTPHTRCSVESDRLFLLFDCVDNWFESDQAGKLRDFCLEGCQLGKIDKEGVLVPSFHNLNDLEHCSLNIGVLQRELSPSRWALASDKLARVAFGMQPDVRTVCQCCGRYDVVRASPCRVHYPNVTSHHDCHLTPLHACSCAGYEEVQLMPVCQLLLRGMSTQRFSSAQEQRMQARLVQVA